MAKKDFTVQAQNPDVYASIIGSKGAAMSADKPPLNIQDVLDAQEAQATQGKKGAKMPRINMAADLTAAFDRAEGNRTMQRLIAEYASKKDLLLVRVFHTAESKAAGAEILRQYTVGILSDPWRFAFDVQEVLEEQGSTV